MRKSLDTTETQLLFGRSDHIKRLHDIKADDRRFRETAVADDKVRAKTFDRLRKDYPERREFQYTTVRVKNARPKIQAKLERLGFKPG